MINIIFLITFCIILFSLILAYFIINKSEFYNNTPVWSYWEPYPPPKIVKKCYKNWKIKGKLNNLNLLRENNVNKFIPKDDYERICKNSENPAVKSDFMGLYLLQKYGGIWIDGSVFLNKNLNWLPKDKFFCYHADRFKDEGICMETFFMYSPKNNIIAKEWYNLLHEIIENDGKENFLKKAEKEFPKITKNMPKEYLWVYVAGKYLLLKNPKLKKYLKTKSAEKGPWYECERNGWENINQICDALKEKKPCTNCEITKIHNGMREKCGAEVVT